VNVYLAKIVLAQLNQQNLRYTQLYKRVLAHCGTPSSFERVFLFLKQGGYVEKSGGEHIAPYRITERGKRFLEVI